MRRVFSIIMMLWLLNIINVSAQNVIKNYHDVPMPDVLREIDEIYTEGNINFIFNELEEFTVTVQVKEKSVMEAIFKIIGFYPIRVIKVENNIYLECWQKEPNKMKGRLVDEDMAPVEFANVQLFNPVDTTFITGGVSNANGDFVIPCEAKRVLLKTHCIGYMPFTREYEVGNIGTVRVHTNAKLLREVKVEQRQVEYNGDKIIAYPTATQLKHSYDFFSLLNQQPFPGLFVDELNQSISVYNGSPIIIIDGVKKSVRDLRAILPKNIKKMEYSMSVPMKYANSGASGVIYIYLKDPKAAGGTFYTNVLSGVTACFVNANTGVTYNQGKSQFSLDYSLNLRDYNERIIDTEESYIADDFRVDLKEAGSSSPFDYNMHDINVGYNYRHDKTMYFSATFKNDFYTRHAEESGYVEDSYAGNYNRVTSNRTYVYNPSLDLYIQKEWAGGHTFEAQVVGSVSDQGYERTYNDVFDTGKESSYPSKVNTDHKSLISEISYVKTFSPNTSVSVGFQNKLSKSENDYVINDYITTLERNDNYAYLNLTQKVGRMNLNIGTGLKYIKMQSERNRREFARNISSLSFAGSPIKNLYIAYTASYNPMLPSLAGLTTLEQTSDGYISITGNPDLKVGHYISNRLALSTGITKRVGVIFINTLNYAINPLYDMLTYKGDGKFLKRTMNYDNSLNYEARLVFTLNEVLDKHLTARVETFYNRYQTKGTDWKHSLNSMGVNLSMTGYFGKWITQIGYRLPFKTLSGEIVSKTEPNSSITVGYRHRNWLFRVSGMLLFHSYGTRYPVWNLSSNNPGYIDCYIKDNANMITLSVRYNVAFGKLFGKTKKRTLHNRDSGAAVMTL